MKRNKKFKTMLDFNFNERFKRELVGLVFKTIASKTSEDNSCLDTGLIQESISTSVSLRDYKPSEDKKVAIISGDIELEFYSEGDSTKTIEAIIHRLKTRSSVFTKIEDNKQTGINLDNEKIMISLAMEIKVPKIKDTSIALFEKIINTLASARAHKDLKLKMIEIDFISLRENLLYMDREYITICIKRDNLNSLEVEILKNILKNIKHLALLNHHKVIPVDLEKLSDTERLENQDSILYDIVPLSSEEESTVSPEAIAHEIFK